MSWLGRFLGAKPELTPQQAARVAAWHALPPPPSHAPLGASRYVVVDVGSSGLNIARDRLIAIGAVAVTNGLVRLDDSFETWGGGGARVTVGDAAGSEAAAVAVNVTTRVGAGVRVGWGVLGIAVGTLPTGLSTFLA